ncbi:hypothetical protein L1887_34300 [Cichorium endivia]|nr:hypothetical protein L1887_34300 [Cichorium endivia]
MPQWKGDRRGTPLRRFPENSDSCELTGRHIAARIADLELLFFLTISVVAVEAMTLQSKPPPAAPQLALDPDEVLKYSGKTFQTEEIRATGMKNSEGLAMAMASFAEILEREREAASAAEKKRYQ